MCRTEAEEPGHRDGMPAGGRMAGTGDIKGDPPSPWIWVLQLGTALKMQKDRHIWALTAVQLACAQQVRIDVYNS